MKNRLARVALGGALVVLATSPLTGTSSAMACAPGFEVVCTTLGTVCHTLGEKICPPLG